MATVKGFGNFSFRIKGNEQIARSLRRAGAELSDLHVAGAQAGAVIVARARVYCPVKTGRLQGSIRVRDPRNGCSVEASRGLIYGPVQHWGWPAHNIRATLFLTRAFTETRAEQLRFYEEDVRRAMRQVTGA